MPAVGQQTKQTPSDNGEFKDQNSSNSQEKIEQYNAGSVSIVNIVEDFKKTLAAIGAPEEINEEVNSYLTLVSTQSYKDNPSSKIIKSNLKNASVILDEYIAQTLNKPSKVVTDWIDALLLQNIDYKAQKPVEEAPVVQQEKNTVQKVAEETVSPEPQPVNKELAALYQNAVDMTDSGKYRRALQTYNELLPTVAEAGDKVLESRIYMDKGYIYDTTMDYPKALENYNKAAELSLKTGDEKLHALAHYNMGSIYDEFGKTDLALAHYYESISYDGQAENLKGQTQTLNDTGNLLSFAKDYRQAIDHYQVGISLTQETDDLKGKGCLLSNVASVFKNIGQDDKALKYYKKSIECDLKTGNLEGYSTNYEYTADIMSRNNHADKAEKLYKKSLSAAQKLGDVELTNRILEKLQRNSVAY